MSANPDETPEDYKFAEQWLKDQRPYIKNTISTISLAIAQVLPDTKWDKKRESNGWIVDNTYFEQPGVSDLKSRIDHTLRLSKLVKEFNEW
jgi:hypothetical protein